MATCSKKLAQHPGTVSAREMARILGTTERQIGFAARRGWLQCKWTKGRRAKFEPDEVLAHLPACPAVFRRRLRRSTFADMAEAAIWAADALMMGVCSVGTPPSAIAVAIYIWAKRNEDNQDVLMRFLVSYVVRGAIREVRSGKQSVRPLPVRDDFDRVLSLLHQHGLTERRAHRLAQELATCG